MASEDIFGTVIFRIPAKKEKTVARKIEEMFGKTMLSLNFWNGMPYFTTKSIADLKETEHGGRRPRANP